MDLIIGASGNIGCELVRIYQKGNRPFRAGLRSVDRFKDQIGDHAEVVFFDFEDTSTFAEALFEIDSVFFIAPHHNPEPSIRNWLLACKEAGIKHLVFSSGRTTGDIEGMPLNNVEGLIRTSGIPYTIVRPGWFMQNFMSWNGITLKTEKTIYLPAGDAKTSFVDVRDIAAAIYQILLDPDTHQSAIYEITGSESLDHKKIAAKLSRFLSSTITYVALSDSNYIQKMKEHGWSEEAALYVIHLYTIVKAGKEAVPSVDFGHLLGRSPITFDGFMEHYKVDLHALIN
jgi:uncharacterized protein YbjT (DUF2867 family)